MASCVDESRSLARSPCRLSVAGTRGQSTADATSGACLQDDLPTSSVYSLRNRLKIHETIITGRHCFDSGSKERKKSSAQLRTRIGCSAPESAFLISWNRIGRLFRGRKLVFGHFGKGGRPSSTTIYAKLFVKNTSFSPWPK